MENKALNLTLYNQMAEVANEVFETYVKRYIDWGEYTIKDINKNKYFAQMPYWWESRDESPEMQYLKEKITFSAGEFVCTVPRCGIFRVMQMWESKLRISVRNKIKFVKEYPGILLLNLLSDIVAFSNELANMGIIAESESKFYPIATCENENLIDFAGMVETARRNNDAREGIWEDYFENIRKAEINTMITLLAILEELQAVMTECTPETADADSNYIDAEITNMGYDPSSFSGPVCVEYPDDCETWAGCGDSIDWQNPVGTAAETMTETQWESVEWDCRYESPVNMDLVNDILTLAAELSKIGVIAEMSARATEIESMGMSAGVIPDSIPETADMETGKEPAETQESPEITPEPHHGDICTQKEKESATEDLNGQIPDICERADQSRGQKQPGKVKRFFGRLKECAAVFL